MALSNQVLAIAQELHTDANKQGTPISFKLALQIAAQVQQNIILQSGFTEITDRLENMTD